MDLIDRDRLPLKQVGLTITGTNWTTTRAVGLYYKCLDTGAHRIKIQFKGVISSGIASINLTIAGISFFGAGTTPQQAAACSSVSDNWDSARTNGVAEIRCSAAGSRTKVALIGDFELSEAPDWV